MISVIMSIYNESPSELSASIESILKQTFSNYEFIIVCDNPDNVDLVRLVQKYASIDKRVHLICNQKKWWIVR